MIAAHAVMWRNDSTRRFDWLRRFAPLEEQQDVALGDIERGETAIAMHFREAEQIFIETLRTGEVIHVKAGFQNAVHLRHSDLLRSLLGSGVPSRHVMRGLMSCVEKALYVLR